MRLSRQKAELHKKACEILKKDVLSYDDKVFVLENWHEGAEHMNGTAGAFFTPQGLARDFQLAVYRHGRVLDLCAGIGSLGFWLMESSKRANTLNELVCVELNEKYIDVGRKILPEAKWVHGSALDFRLIKSLGHFDQVISNPPFGNIKTGGHRTDWLSYTGSDFELKLIDIASRISDNGAFILPQLSTPFRYSGKNQMTEERSSKVVKFEKQTGLDFEFNCGIDTSVYVNDWKGVKPICEIVTFDFCSLY